MVRDGDGNSSCSDIPGAGNGVGCILSRVRVEKYANVVTWNF